MGPILRGFWCTEGPMMPKTVRLAHDANYLHLIVILAGFVFGTLYGPMMPSTVRVVHVANHLHLKTFLAGFVHHGS